MLLLYCMIPDNVPLACGAITGVGEAELKEIAKNGVRYFYSAWQPANGANEVREQALEFHRTNQKILEHATLIPFRFPTHVSNEAELATLMEAHSGDYAAELSRLDGMVQMKVTIEGSSHSHTAATSGTEYLRQRQMANAPMESAVQAIQSATKELIVAAKRARRGNATIVFLLLERRRTKDVRSAVEALVEMPVKVSFSGPWPPSEFVNFYPEPAVKP